MPDSIPQRCADHAAIEKELLTRVESLEESVTELYSLVKDSATEKRVQEIAEKSTKEIKELKDELAKLRFADLKHTEALAGIYEILRSFKETQELMRTENKENMKVLREEQKSLADCYQQVSIHIASLSAILAERARIQEQAQKKEMNETKETSSLEITPKDPWYVRLFARSKPLAYAAVALLTALIYFIFSHVTEIFDLLKAIFGK